LAVYIFQDDPDSDGQWLRDAKQTGNARWNLRGAEESLIESGGTALFWIPFSGVPNSDLVRGIHAWGRIDKRPYLDPDSEGTYKVDVANFRMLEQPLPVREIRRSNLLANLDIWQDPHAHRVFVITGVQLQALRGLRPEMSK